MKIEMTEYGDVQLISLQGKLDVHFAPKMLELLEDIIDDNKIKIVIDLKNVQFISSYGLGSLVTALKTVTAKGGALKLAGLKKELKTSFEITGLASRFEFFDDSNKALQSFSS